MGQRIKNIVFTAMSAVVLFAGTVSAHQLYRPFQTTCRGFCSKKVACPNILGCACVKQPGFTTGTCELIAARPGQ